ncbi:hypothetical protein C8A03DRAFT_35184 [Achaetomium macrosporum]|uniref:Uncharacterized protein n=1 Tax=Achaetomium macrosporum TaxID=79813 RepID=A0AAN7H9T8_9PEZI|nr:hypothetical protein C8A03DRAFT_35184 [Achaetomium macrosporum]
MGDAFRPPSPAPFGVVTEAAVNRERERDLVRQNIGRVLDAFGRMGELAKSATVNKMGGKIWSKEEENIFWKELLSHSPKRLGDDFRKNKEKG